MTYSIKIDEIDLYCIKNFHNYEYGIKILKNIQSLRNTLEYLPHISKKIKGNHYKIVMDNVPYSLYMEVNDETKTVIIYDIVNFKQKQ